MGRGNLCRSRGGVCAGTGMGCHTAHPVPRPVHRFSHGYTVTLHTRTAHTVQDNAGQVCIYSCLHLLTLMHTGKHSHLHIQIGKCHGWNNNGNMRYAHIWLFTRAHPLVVTMTMTKMATTSIMTMTMTTQPPRPQPQPDDNDK